MVFAMKCMQKEQICNYKLSGNILYEKQMMVESDHPFVLKLFRTFQDADSLMMLLEIVPGGELFTWEFFILFSIFLTNTFVLFKVDIDWLNNFNFSVLFLSNLFCRYLQGCPGNHVTSPHARFISMCVVAVFDYIHEKGICYRDLKPENLMIDGDGYIKMVSFIFPMFHRFTQLRCVFFL